MEESLDQFHGTEFPWAFNDYDDGKERGNEKLDVVCDESVKDRLVIDW
jgi:hypothetical protein